MEKKLVIVDGNNFSDLEGFYDEVEKVLTKDLNWGIGHNLDAFNDLLHGGFGIHEYGEPISLFWKSIAKSRQDLGIEETIKWYKEKQQHKDSINYQYFQDKLTELTNGNGETLFDVILNIIKNHEDVEFKFE